MGIRRGQPAESLFDADKVDLVALPEAGDVVELFVVQDAPWTGSDAQLGSLRAKVQAYVAYALDGQLTAAYPETQGLPWRIVVHSQTDAPDERTAGAITTLAGRVRQHGGELVTRVGSAAP
jgi:hypothetical protein